MGGKVAMEVALTVPARVKRLVVVDIAPVSYPKQADGHMQVIAGMKALELDGLDSRATAEAFLRRYIDDEPTRKFVLTNLIRNPGGSYYWRLNLPAIEKDYDALREMPEHISAFQKPTLFVKGAESAYIQSKHRERTLAYFPRSDVKIIMGAGHWLHADKPQVFQKIAMDFLTAQDCAADSSLAVEKMQ
jgi:esterase